ncbi:hypothetical protein FWH30_01160 [Microgenomates group bacterium]|nr:hypothetical protein [Microgenomates group bacterium]
MTWAEFIKAVGKENAMLKSVLYLASKERETEEELVIKVRRKFHEGLLKKSANKRLLSKLGGKKITIVLEEVEGKKSDVALINVPPENGEAGGYKKVETKKEDGDGQVAEVMACLV